jgi:hypothetical protein
VFGWIKQWGGLRQFKLRGTENVSAVFGLHVIAYNLIRWASCSNRRWRRHEELVAQRCGKAKASRELKRAVTAEISRFELLKR